MVCLICMLQVWDSAHSDSNSPHADPHRQLNGFSHNVAPDICAPLTPAALEWLHRNEPLLQEAAAAAKGTKLTNVTFPSAGHRPLCNTLTLLWKVQQNAPQRAVIEEQSFLRCLQRSRCCPHEGHWLFFASDTASFMPSWPSTQMLLAWTFRALTMTLIAARR